MRSLHDHTFFVLHFNTNEYRKERREFQGIAKNHLIIANMKKLLFLLSSLTLLQSIYAQHPDVWKISADKIDPSNYYGITVANGMIGIVSSPEPFKVKDVVLAGAYDLYGRGRVSNFLRSFNLLNMQLDIDGKRIGAAQVADMKQELA